MMKSLVAFLPVAIFWCATAGASPIHEAAENGPLSEVLTLLDESPVLLEAADDDGNTPLLCAASGGQLDIVRLLLERGADLAARNSRQTTALHMAAYEGHPEIVRFLLDHDVEINATNAGGFSPLMHAAYSGNTDAARLLIDKGAEMNIADDRWGGRAFHWASSKGDAATLEVLFERQNDLQTPSTIDSSTPIFWAANAGNIEALHFLFGKGISGHATTPDGWTPLHNAARRGHLEAAQLLLDHGARLDFTDEQAMTPLFTAIVHDQTEMAEFLLNRGANAAYVDSHGMTAIHWAAARENLEMVKTLVAAGVDVNTTDQDGTTPMARIVYGDNLELARLLLDSGAEVNIVNDHGETLLHRAVMQGRESLAALFLESGAEINRTERRHDRTPLHWAAIKGNLYLTNLLLAHGAEINAPDNGGYTPLYYAGKYGHETVAAALTAKGGKAKNVVENFGHSPLLKQDFAPREAVVWYLGHCGYGIKTKNHFLVFDYWNREGDPDQPLLANGHVNPAEIADQNVVIFSSHEHQDHFDPVIFEWQNKLDNITYVYGFRPEELPENQDSGYAGPAYEYLGPRENKSVGQLDISTITANDAGVGFLVKVDGLNIYFAGDHAGWEEGQREVYTREIDYLAVKVTDLDFAFVNVTGCHVQDTISLEESVCYTLETLKPKCWCPTHGLDREFVYDEFAAKIANRGFVTPVFCPDIRGDYFIYRQKKETP